MSYQILEFKMQVICLFYLVLMPFTCPNHWKLLFLTINNCNLYYFILFSCQNKWYKLFIMETSFDGTLFILWLPTFDSVFMHWKYASRIPFGRQGPSLLLMRTYYLEKLEVCSSFIIVMENWLLTYLSSFFSFFPLKYLNNWILLF